VNASRLRHLARDANLRYIVCTNGSRATLSKIHLVWGYIGNGTVQCERSFHERKRESKRTTGKKLHVGDDCGYE